MERWVIDEQSKPSKYCTVQDMGQPDGTSLIPICTPRVLDFPMRSGRGGVEADKLQTNSGRLDVC